MTNEAVGGGLAVALAVAVAGGIGKILATYARGYVERRNKTTADEAASIEARERRNFELTQAIIEDLQGAIERMGLVIAERDATIDRLRAERDDAKAAALDARLRAMELDRNLAAASKLHEDLRHEQVRQASEYERRISNCNDDLEDARETLAKLNRRATGPLERE